MDNLFPPMFDKPENGMGIVSLIYWIFCFMLIPFVVLVLLVGLQDNMTVVSWFDIVFYGVNFLFVVTLLRRYFADSFLNVQIHTKAFIGTVAACAVGMLLCFACGLMLAFRCSFYIGFNTLPMSETSVLASTSVIVATNPVFGILCMTLLTPVTVCGLFYTAVFAPIAVNRRPWLAYLVTAAALLVPRIFIGWWREDFPDQFGLYLLQLPVHMLACWSYQKADTVWAPMISLSITNLISGLILFTMYQAGIIYIA